MKELESYKYNRYINNKESMIVSLGIHIVDSLQYTYKEVREILDQVLLNAKKRWEYSLYNLSDPRFEEYSDNVITVFLRVLSIIHSGGQNEIDLTGCMYDVDTSENDELIKNTRDHSYIQPLIECYDWEDEFNLGWDEYELVVD